MGISNENISFDTLDEYRYFLLCRLESLLYLQHKYKLLYILDSMIKLIEELDDIKNADILALFKTNKSRIDIFHLTFDKHLAFS